MRWHRQSAIRNPSRSSCLIDIDHFKAINDNFGHLKGDDVLKELSKMLEELVRKSDSVGRWGGEEFMILCPGTKKEGAEQLAEKIRVAFEKGLDVTCSFGVAELLKKESEGALIHRVDQAMYRAKEAGRNRIECDDH